MSALSTDSSHSLNVSNLATFNWDVACTMSRKDATALITASMSRHLTPPTFRAVGVFVYLLLTVGLVAVDSFAWAFFVPLIGLAHASRRMSRDFSWVTDQLDSVHLTDDQLRAVATIVTLCRSVTVTRTQFKQLLATPPSEVSCAVFGQHLKGFCPHTTTVW